MKQVDLLEDLSKLSYVEKTVYSRLCEHLVKCIGHGLFEEMENDNTPYIEYDIGIGILSLFYDGENITYKFKPSNKLERCLINTIENNESPLVTEVESVLTRKVLNAYKDLL